jgi:hypothetical protein
MLEGAGLSYPISSGIGASRRIGKAVACQGLDRTYRPHCRSYDAYAHKGRQFLGNEDYMIESDASSAG